MQGLLERRFRLQIVAELGQFATEDFVSRYLDPRSSVAVIAPDCRLSRCGNSSTYPKYPGLAIHLSSYIRICLFIFC